METDSKPVSNVEPPPEATQRTCHKCGAPLSKYCSDLCRDCVLAHEQLYDVDHRRRIFLHD